MTRPSPPASGPGARHGWRGGGLQALAHYCLGRAAHAQGDYRRAAACYSRPSRPVTGRGATSASTWACARRASRAWLAWCHAEMGQFTEGRALGDEALQMAEAGGASREPHAGRLGIGLWPSGKGTCPGPSRVLERAVGLCHEADLPGWFPMVAAVLGAAYTLAGRGADALPLLTQAVERSLEHGKAWCPVS